ncbi:hypothetical protein SNEBB_005572 [Seison nebaliae]|nr:hypothetical protein SNEBB_005572 [Seison nebaliae]
MKYFFLTLFVVCIVIQAIYGQNVVSDQKLETATYILTVPTNVPQGNKLKFSLILLKDNGISDFTVIIKGKPNKYNVKISKKFDQEDFYIDSNDFGSSDWQTYEVKIDGKSEKARVYVVKNENKLLIQTDKATYKPGDKVQFRVVAVDRGLMPITSNDVEIQIIDSLNNILVLWKDKSMENGLIDNLSYLISKETNMGTWTIKIRIGINKQSKSFVVEEYVLPKYKVEIIVPTSIKNTLQTASGIVSAQYTIGKPVEGKAVIRIGPQWGRTPEPQIFESEINGKLTFPINLKEFNRWSNIKIEANVTESLTGKMLKAEQKSIRRHDNDIELKWLSEFPTLFSDRIKGGVEAISYLNKDEKIPGIKLNVSVIDNGDWRNRKIVSQQMLVTDDLGQIKFNVDGLKNASYQVEIHCVDDKDDCSTYGMNQYFRKKTSLNNIVMDITTTPQRVMEIGEMVQIEATLSEPFDKQTFVVLQLMGRGEVLVHHKKFLQAGQKSIKFNAQINKKMSPKATVMVFSFNPNNEIIAASVEISVKSDFVSGVDLSFNKKEAKPGDTVELRAKTLPNSLVSFLAVDESVLLLRSGNDIDEQDLLNYIYDLNRIRVDWQWNTWSGGIGAPPPGRPMPMPIIEPEIEPPIEINNEIVPKNRIRNKRSIMCRGCWWPTPIEGQTAFDTFKNTGIRYFTNAQVKEPAQMRFPMPMMEMQRPENIAFDGAFSAKGNGGGQQLNVRVRKNFVETWIFDTVSTPNGIATIKKELPDTITSWVATAFALNSKKGLMLSSESAKIKGFIPFFIRLTLPYSVIRLEKLGLNVLLFNYQDKPIKNVEVRLKLNENIKKIFMYKRPRKTIERARAMMNDWVINVDEIPAQSAKSIIFPIRLTKVGKIPIRVEANSGSIGDIVVKDLLVRPEGSRICTSGSVLIEPGKEEMIPIDIPPFAVKDSKFIRISAVGDILGNSMNNLDKLLRMPYGCGEQNILSLAPNIFVSMYLESIRAYTDDLKSKAKQHMEQGYQRELEYRHDDGSFSAFGKNDKSGSTWLTAFVLKVFFLAERYINIDGNMLSKAVEFIEKNTDKEGFIKEPGKVIHKEMQGGVNSKLTITAYVVIALYEADISKQTNSVKALEDSINKSLDAYTLSIITYALHLAESPKASEALALLEAKAVKKDNMMYWTDNVKNEKKYGTPKSKDVEMTSYALLTYSLITDKTKGEQSKMNAILIMRYIASKQNANGGFSSTQDTVLALQALSMFGQVLKSDETDMNVYASIIPQNIPPFIFNINANNARVLQRQIIPNDVSAVIVKTTGNSGLGIFSVEYCYNLRSQVNPAEFSITQKITNEPKPDDDVDLQICASYIGDEEKTPGMVLIESEFFGGFQPISLEEIKNINKLDSLQKIETIDETEEELGKIVFYLDSISKEEICINWRMTPSGTTIIGPQDVQFKIYDYYDPTRTATGKFYYGKGTKRFCDICLKGKKDCIVGCE